MNDATTALLEDLGRLANDPLAFVRWAFPWSEVGGELEKEDGPDTWQIDVLNSIRDGLRTPEQAIREATASGHGIGKSALVAWIILWAISTFEDCRGILTANTESQLRTKTWPELGKWYRNFIARDLFKLTATTLHSADPEHERTWRIDMIPWSEHNPEAFAGLHNEGKRTLIIFDEASAIADVIWETVSGALTDVSTQRIWAVFGNPTKNTGRFRECFPGGSAAHRWRSREIDSRSVRRTDKAEFNRWVQDFGEDSDYVRVRVLGKFPRIGDLEFISRAVAYEASLRVPDDTYGTDPLVLGVDVARFGDDASVIYFRRGRDGQSIPPQLYRGLDTVQLAARVADAIAVHKPDAVMVDGGGVGGGVVDNLRSLGHSVFDIQFGGKADRIALEGDASKFGNKRAEMWGYMRAWLRGGSIPKDDGLVRQLAGPMYSFNNRDEIILEAKKEMKGRGLESPDMADALALTFAYPVMGKAMQGFAPKVGLEWDYDPFELARAA